MPKGAEISETTLLNGYCLCLQRLLCLPLTGRPAINSVIQICQTSAAEPIGIKTLQPSWLKLYPYLWAEVTEQAGLYHDNMHLKRKCRQLRLLIVNAVCFRLAKQQNALCASTDVGG
jgi:hypothetical protein